MSGATKRDPDGAAHWVQGLDSPRIAGGFRSPRASPGVVTMNAVGFNRAAATHRSLSPGGSYTEANARTEDSEGAAHLNVVEDDLDNSHYGATGAGTDSVSLNWTDDLGRPQSFSLSYSAAGEVDSDHSSAWVADSPGSRRDVGPSVSNSRNAPSV